jgi:hypothetical protein
MEINLQGVQMNSLILSPSAKKYQLITFSSETVITDGHQWINNMVFGTFCLKMAPLGCWECWFH